ncbi:serpin B8-like [Stegodyphus dumicola]|uniref:serpin B8-like n=1 Tax=Stegodyphus dumicola TaxID=202533 RepID=UPI0015A77F63|nr:serpin B8-like [Stegodyphus dumicola]
MGYQMLCVFFLLVMAVFAQEGEDSCSEDEKEEEGEDYCVPLTPAEIRMKKLVPALNDFAFNLQKKFAHYKNEDAYFSPLSLATVFAMLHYGSRGKTAQELGNMLGFAETNLTNDEVHTAFNELLKKIPWKSDIYRLTNANALLVDKTASLFRDYKISMKQVYNGSVRGVDFETKSSEIKSDANDWVKRKTRGEIHHIVNRIAPNTKFAILSAAHFKGKWKTKFELNNTRKEIFNNGGFFRLAKEVPMMHMRATLPYKMEEGFKILELPYEDENLSMLVLLPKHNDNLPNLESAITAETLKLIRRNMHRTRVIVSMPRVKLEYSNELSGIIHAAGAKKIFQERADFSGMMRNRSVFVRLIMHSTLLEISECGTEAALETPDLESIRRSFMSLRIPLFIVNRPFMIIIIDNRNDMILFMGRIIRV